MADKGTFNLSLCCRHILTVLAVVLQDLRLSYIHDHRQDYPRVRPRDLASRWKSSNTLSTTFMMTNVR